MTPAFACDDDPAHLRQLKRQTEAMEDQVRAARWLARIERAKLRLLDQQRRVEW
jgi:hypothetical protein